MEKFVGRRKELDMLDSTYGKGKAVLIYGRRRTGKTALIKQFCKGKRTLFLCCIDGPLEYNLEYIHQMVTEFRGEDSGRYRGFLDMKNDLAKVCVEGNNIIVIDEYQYLLKADKTIDSFIQQLVDSTLESSESTLILCGSSVSVMKATGEDASRPLYGRFRHRINLMPLSMEECRQLHPRMPDHDQLMLYLIFGGIPRYHVESDEGSFEEYFRKNCIEDPWIADEALFLLKADFHDSGDCGAILSAIAKGSVTAKEITERTHIGTKYVDLIKRMMDNGVIGIVNPMLGAPKRPTYYISDEFLAFYYSVMDYRSNLFLNKDPDRIYDELYPYMKTHMGIRFELYCQKMVSREYPTLEIGRWWRDDSKRDIHEDIDIVAKLSVGRFRVDLFAECIFTSKKVGFPQYNLLEHQVSPFTDRTNPCMMMISESGFEEEFEEFAKDTGVMLIGPEEIYGHRPFPKPLPEQ